MAKINLHRRLGKIDNVATACGVGRHRSSECFEYKIKPLQGNLRTKHGVVALRRFKKGQRVHFWEDKGGKVFDIVAAID